jgi:hypothetical protein
MSKHITIPINDTVRLTYQPSAEMSPEYVSVSISTGAGWRSVGVIELGWDINKNPFSIEEFLVACERLGKLLVLE